MEKERGMCVFGGGYNTVHLSWAGYKVLKKSWLQKHFLPYCPCVMSCPPQREAFPQGIVIILQRVLLFLPNIQVDCVGRKLFFLLQNSQFLSSNLNIVKL